MIVIGSTALAYYKADVVPNDLDLVGSYEEAVAFGKKWGAKAFYPINEGKTIFMKNREGKICEFEITWPGSKAEHFHDWLLGAAGCGDFAYKYDDKNEWWVPCMGALYMLKMSHRYLKNSPHFLKTMRDIQWMRQQGCEILDEAWQKEHERLTYTYGHPKLDVKKSEFFDSEATGVWQKYDHDTLHLAVAIGDKPAYTTFSVDEVKCSRELFEQQSDFVKLCAVLEESYVLALERSLVPFPGKKTPKEAFLVALGKVCTSITSGWFREYAWNNYDAVQMLYSQFENEWLLKFDNGVRTGIVKEK